MRSIRRTLRRPFLLPKVSGQPHAPAALPQGKEPPLSIGCFSKIHYNIILPSTPRSCKWSLPFRFSDQHFVCISHLSHTCYTPFPSHPPWLDRPNNIWWIIFTVIKFIWNVGSFRLGRCSPTRNTSVLSPVEVSCKRKCFGRQKFQVQRRANPGKGVGRILFKVSTVWVLTLESERISKRRIKVSNKVKLSLCLTKHHAMKTYWRSGGIAPRILWPRH
jgi:hypothetical protein